MARRYSDRKKLRRSCFWSSGRWLKSMPADSFDQIFRPPVVQGKDALSKPPKGAVRNSGQPRAHVVQEMVGEQTQERRKQDQVAGGARPKLVESSESLLKRQPGASLRSLEKISSVTPCSTLQASAANNCSDLFRAFQPKRVIVLSLPLRFSRTRRVRDGLDQGVGMRKIT